MNTKARSAQSNNTPWKNESSRQRWELFHRAIAHAKESNVAAMDEADSDSVPSKASAAFLYVAK